MIATFLIFSATVRRAQVKRVVGLQVFLQAKGDADEATGTLSAAGSGAPASSTSMVYRWKTPPPNQRKLADKK